MASKSHACLNYGRIYKRTYRSGRSSWTIDYRDENGKRIQKALPHAQSRGEAVSALQKKVTEVFDRKYRVQQKREEIGFKTFAQIYLEDYAMATKKSWETDTSRLRIMDEFFKDIELREITPLMIQKFRAWRLEEGNSKSTSNRYLALLKRMFTIAIGEGYLEENVVKKVKFFSEKDTLKERILPEDEEVRLMATCSDALRPILVVALNTGMRKGEILDLQWNQVDFKTRRIRVEKTKSGKVRHIPINDVLLHEFHQLEGKEPRFVFFNPETMKPYVDMKKGFKAACRRASIKGMRFHDLRHTFATRLVERGVDLITVKELLGHSTVRITERYTHPNQDRKRAAVELLGCDVSVTHGRINQRCARSSADRAVDFESEGRGFESLRACQLFSHLTPKLFQCYKS